MSSGGARQVSRTCNRTSGSRSDLRLFDERHDDWHSLRLSTDYSVQLPYNPCRKQNDG